MRERKPFENKVNEISILAARKAKARGADDFMTYLRGRTDGYNMWKSHFPRESDRVTAFMQQKENMLQKHEQRINAWLEREGVEHRVTKEELARIWVGDTEI